MYSATARPSSILVRHFWVSPTVLEYASISTLSLPLVSSTVRLSVEKVQYLSIAPCLPEGSRTRHPAIQLRGRFTEPVGLTQSRYLPEVSEDAHTLLNSGVFVETAGQ